MFVMFAMIFQSASLHFLPSHTSAPQIVSLVVVPVGWEIYQSYKI